MTTKLVLALFTAYWLGSIPFAYIAVRILKGIDIRKHGSGNVGATNVFRLAGPLPGSLVAILDLLKGFAAVWLCDLLVPGSTIVARLAAGMMAIVGHNWPLWLGFKGGRGVLTTAGVFLYLSWIPALGALAVFGIVFWISRYVSLGSLSAVTVFPLLMVLTPSGRGCPVMVGMAVTAAIFVYIRHIPNIRRLVSGTEYRFGEK